MTKWAIWIALRNAYKVYKKIVKCLQLVKEVCEVVMGTCLICVDVLF